MQLFVDLAAQENSVKSQGQMQEKSYFDYDLISYTVATTVSAESFMAERSKDVKSKTHDNSWCVSAREESIEFEL